MHMTVFIAARTLGEISEWRVSNLQMQKALYVAHMLHLGRTAQPLFAEHFEAWDFGPVVPQLYQKLKGRKREPVLPFPSLAFTPESTQYCAIADAFALTRMMSPGQLITCLHRPGGAWEKHYSTGITNCRIMNSDIVDEFGKFVWPSDEAVAWAEQMADEVAAHPSPYLSSADERAFGSRVLSARCH
jgi:uncharacterized phage-associated protein